MFSKIRRQLTLLYSGFMVFFLLTFVGIIYSGLTWAVYSEEKQEMLLFAEEEAQEHSVILRNRELLQQMGKVENYRGGRMFFYAFDNNGELANSSEAYPEFQKAVRQKINEWNVEDGGVVITIAERNGRDAILMMSSLPVMIGDERLGTVYVGRDVTEFYKLLKNLFIAMMLISLLFLLLASGGGYMMAGRAIIPIKKSYERQREFVADASHELRTPLSIFMASVDVIQGDKDSDMSPVVKQVISDMKNEIKKMSNIVSDMLTLARADAAPIHIIKEKFSLRPVAEQAVRSLYSFATKKDVELNMESPDEIWIVADKERISQLLFILLDNAIKYTPAGGKVYVGIAASENKNRGLTITIKDTGMGIPPEYYELIFERFYRVDKARSREIGGSGLGLAIAKWIITAHEGEIKVSSKVGEGSTFTVNLPQG
jgi:two-component system sensor histidine kinase CiaH